MVRPLVDYPDDDDEDAMDTKPEDAPEQPEEGPHPEATSVAVDLVSEAAATSVLPTTQALPVPERLAEKRRREDEDEDELVKLAAGSKRRSSTSSNSGAGILNRKKTLSIGSKGFADKSGVAGALGGVTGSAPPKRIAINLGPVAKSPAPEVDIASVETVPSENSEQENRDSSQGDKGG